MDQVKQKCDNKVLTGRPSNSTTDLVSLSAQREAGIGFLLGNKYFLLGTIVLL
jgi:hypothetical protein